MQDSIIDRLFASFSDLEQAIGSAKNTLSQKGNIPEEIMKRIESYDSILEKQRGLASSLCEHINAGNWDEVSRHVNLINGLSAMIRDDARAILAAISGNSKATDQKDEKINYC